MSAAPSAFIPGPGRLSNRSLLERFKAWGCNVTIKGDRAKVITPDRCNYEFLAPHVHAKNDARIVLQAVECIGTTWETFCTRTKGGLLAQVNAEINETVNEAQDALVAVAQDAQDEFDRRQKAREERDARKAEARRQKEESKMQSQSQPEVSVVDLTDVDVVRAVQEAAPLRTPRSTNAPASISTRVFDLLADEGKPLSIYIIAQRLGIKTQQASAACISLMEQDVAVRVKKAVYRIAEDHAHQDVRVDVVARAENGQVAQTVSVAQPTPADPPTAASAPPVAIPAPVPTPAVAGADPTDAVVNDVLDLMFPMGMNVRAGDLDLLQSWKALTREVFIRFSR